MEIKIIKFINRLIQNKRRYRKKWKKIGHYEGFQDGRKSAKKELVEIREMANIKIEEITFKVREEIANRPGEYFAPDKYCVQYSFRPEHEAYRILKQEVYTVGKF